MRSQLAMTWGVETFLVDKVDSTDAMIRQVDHAILSIGRFKPGDLVVVVAGSPPRRQTRGNEMRCAANAAFAAFAYVNPSESESIPIPATLRFDASVRSTTRLHSTSTSFSVDAHRRREIEAAPSTSAASERLSPVAPTPPPR